MSEAIPLLDLTHLRFQGPDAERYLNGQVTQQVEGLDLGHSRYTFVCDAKGRILFDGTIHRDGEGFLLSVQGGERDEIFTRMDRYLIADDCELKDESDRWTILHLSPSEEHSQAGLINRFGTPGQDIYQERLPNTEATDANSLPNELNNLRIAEGIPRVPDLVGALPAETGLEEIAVSFHKGCYLGQEVISRMKRAGKTNRKLTQVFLSKCPTEIPAKFTAEDSGKIVFETTSIASEASKFGIPALGYLNSKCGLASQLQNSEGIEIVFQT